MHVYNMRACACAAVRCGGPQIDAGMKLSLWLAGSLLITTCTLMFVLVLEAKAFQEHSLAVLNAFLAYPIVAYSAFSVYQVKCCRT